MSEDEEEDWFERALEETPSEDAPDDWDEWAGDDVDSDDVDARNAGDVDDPGTDDAGTGDDAGSALGDGDATEPSSEATVDADLVDQTGGGASPTANDDDGGDADSGGGLFDDDFAAAMGDAPDVAGPSGGQGGSGGAVGPGGGGGLSGGEFGMGGDLDVDDEFGMGVDDDFGMGGGDFGMGGGGGFDAEEEYETDLPRIDLGIDGLDEMIQGGVPERSLMVTIGSAGTGKTTFALQFLHEALEQGDRGIYITLEESRERVINSASEKGLEFDKYADNGQLAVVDLDPVEMANSLRSIRSELPRLIESFDATRLVLDSVSLLEMMYDDRAKRRNEIYDFTNSLKNAGVTTMLTSEASDEHAYTSRHGIVEYLTDAVFVLQYVRPDDFRETRLAIEIQKIRDANHSRETKPYEITNEGISVYRQANIF
ncbi:KaiC domain-containing protein [Halorubellus salinus]|uniref:KaiC domain-containing protein n=1 Tax=Halorubellus salinus TaxID=755309 RepID=UPI001D0991B7|nr:KaiC domain-containing protein [Halorubellus salinus]